MKLCFKAVFAVDFFRFGKRCGAVFSIWRARLRSRAHRGDFYKRTERIGDEILLCGGIDFDFLKQLIAHIIPRLPEPR